MWATLALGAFQAIGSAQQAALIRENGLLNQELGSINAKYLDLDAYNAEKFGHTEQARYQTTIDETVDKQREGFAQKGIDVNFGTAAEVQADTRVTGVLNLLDIQNQAHAKALGFTQQASNTRLQGYLGVNQSNANASATQTAGLFGALGTGISGYSKSMTPYPTDNSGTRADEAEFAGV